MAASGLGWWYEPESTRSGMGVSDFFSFFRKRHGRRYQKVHCVGEVTGVGDGAHSGVAGVCESDALESATNHGRLKTDLTDSVHHGR